MRDAILGKNLYVQEIAAMVKRLIKVAGARKIRDVIYFWAGLSLKQVVAFKDIVAFATSAKDKKSLLKQMICLGLPCDVNNPDEMQLVASIIPVMVDLLPHVADDPDLIQEAVSEIEDGVKLLVEHAVIDQAQANAMLVQYAFHSGG
jgi:hypothetical protein